MLARAQRVPHLPLRLLSRASAFAAEWLRTPIHQVILNLDNVDRGIARLAMVNLVSDIPSSLNADFAAFALAEGGLIDEGEPVLERLGRVSRPVLFFAGGKDHFAPPNSVRAAFDAWGRDVPGAEKRFVLLAQSAGARGDYGHGDLVIGRHVKTDVLEPIAAFLAEQDARL
jgi:hypothetical protein